MDMKMKLFLGLFAEFCQMFNVPGETLDPGSNCQIWDVTSSVGYPLQTIDLLLYLWNIYP